MLFERRFHSGIREGQVTLTFRAWARPQVKPTGRYRTQVGMLVVEAVDRVKLGDVRDAEARRAGFTDAAELTAYVKKKSRKALRASSPVFRVKLRFDGPVTAGDRPPADDAALSAEDVATLTAKLDAMDRRCADGPFTRRLLALIERRPRVSSSVLAPELGREKLAFKADVRKLKKLGLTVSHEVGYALSPRGRAYLAAVARGSAAK